MSQTIPGGAYQNPDGSWVDANNRPLSQRAVQQFQAQQVEKEQALQQAEQNRLLAQLAPLPALVNQAPARVAPGVTAVTDTQPPPLEPVDSEEEEEAPSKTRKSRGK